ncbi:MAG: glycosyltransferase [Bacteroidota bacterium]|nr:glycosyltransferase [Bacteroidota bacterium]
MKRLRKGFRSHFRDGTAERSPRPGPAQTVGHPLEGGEPDQLGHRHVDPEAGSGEPSISVIIPTLNEQELLPGLLEQMPSEFRRRHGIEIIVSDGGSSDDTPAIALAAGCTLVRTDGSGKQTIAAGRNAGASVARAPLLVFLNADVLLDDPEAFFTTVRETAERADAATCAVHVFPSEERLSDRIFHSAHNTYVRLLNFLGEGMGRGECQVIRKSLFEALGGYNASLAAGEDYDLFRRVRRRTPIAFMRGTIVYESPRRFRRMGYVRILFEWTRNALAVALRHRSIAKEWEAVR